MEQPTSMTREITPLTPDELDAMRREVWAEASFLEAEGRTVKLPSVYRLLATLDALVSRVRELEEAKGEQGG